MIIIAGPCQIESREHLLTMAKIVANVQQRLGRKIIFKASFDKANRTSGRSARGVGLKEAINLFKELRPMGMPLTTDVHETYQVNPIAEVVDVIQIPALLSRQTDLITEAGQTDRIVNIKKGQFMSPIAATHAGKKAAPSEVWLTERGTTFGYGDLVVDMRSIPLMEAHGFPVLFDCTHSLQTPPVTLPSSGGSTQRWAMPRLAAAAIAAGASGLFIETHNNPEKAMSDGDVMLHSDKLEAFLRPMLELYRAVGRLSFPETGQ